MLGFTLPENFRTPYRSANLQEFWRRWHISLSTWLRDYLYITLGGNRGRPWRTYLNLILTMLLGGLWHGASWAFIVWGALHGFGLAITRASERMLERGGRLGRWFAATFFLAVAGAGAHWAWARSHQLTLLEHLVLGWLWGSPIWAVLSATLASGLTPHFISAPTRRAPLAEGLRWGAAGLGLAALVCLRFWAQAVLPLAAVGTACTVFSWLLERQAIDRAAIFWLSRRALAILLTFIYVCLAWIFFRAASLDRANEILERIALGHFESRNLSLTFMTVLTLSAILHFAPDDLLGWLKRGFGRLPAPIAGLVLAAAALLLRELSLPESVQFYYYQF